MGALKTKSLIGFVSIFVLFYFRYLFFKNLMHIYNVF